MAALLNRHLVVDMDIIADEQRRAAAPAVIFDDMRPQVSAVFAIDDRAAGGAGVALVRYDQLKRVAEQFDMLVIDRGDAGLACTDQTHRVIAPADAGLEHRKVAFALLEMQAGKREQRDERAMPLLECVGERHHRDSRCTEDGHASSGAGDGSMESPS